MNKAEQMGVSRVRPSGYKVLTKSGAEVIDALREAVKTHNMVQINGTTVDAFSASVVILIYDAVNEANKAKLAAMDLPHMIRVAFATMERHKEMRC